MYGATDGNFASNAGAFSAMTQDALTVQCSPYPVHTCCFLLSSSITTQLPTPNNTPRTQVLNDVPFSLPHLSLPHCIRC
jgi:hypothetical protein